MNVFSKKNENYPTILGIILLLFLLFIAYPLLARLSYAVIAAKKLNAASFFASRLYYWVFLLIMWLYSFKKEKSPLLLWKDKTYKFWIYIISFVAIYVITAFSLTCIQGILILLKLYKVSTNFNYILEIFRNNKSLLVFTALTAGIVEELLFRGYLQPRLALIFRNQWLAIIITACLFGLLHYGYGTLVNIIGPFIIGIVFSVYYWKFRNIKLLVVFHFAWDLLLLFMQLRAPHH